MREITLTLEAGRPDLMEPGITVLNVRRRGHDEPDDTPGETLILHHEVDLLPSGNLLALGTQPPRSFIRRQTLTAW